MRDKNWPVVVMFTITLLAGTIVGSALRAGMHESATMQAGEPYWLASK